MAESGEDLVTAYDSAPLDARYWTSIALGISTSIFDYFDYYVVGFLVAVLAPQWQLTFGQTSLILLSAGVGAILGSLAWGALADRFGRKVLLVAGVALCALSSGSVALIPDGAWVMFAVLRFFVGFGVGAAASVAVPLIVEYTPTRHRTLVTSATVIPVSLGILAASLSAATLLHQIGWRGLAALGFLPLLPALLIAFIMPESVRWLVSRGRDAEARRIVARALRVAPDALPPSPAIATTAQPQGAGFVELLQEPRRIWLTLIVWFGASTANYGVFLWGPTIVALLMGVSAVEVAHLFVIVSLTGMIGRAIFSVLAHRIGRRRCGEIMGYGIAISLGAAGLLFDQTLFGYPAFMVLLVPAALFFDGGFSNIAPYSAEIFPVRLSARGVGLAQAANGVGKIAGPLCLALIAGTSNLITPRATIDAVTPAFLFLAACGLVIGLAFTLLGVETHGRPLALEVRQPGESAGTAASPLGHVAEDGVAARPTPSLP
ncbi:4-hydroxybenzoate transporter PcaK [Bradyrhizobium ivorense]|uniref:4-hydroxybenzoate transporter PcaK n=1 Tax=Bradyrhizobium ivorense TaxID=2511166 RepID=A0A508TD70_9BRAD|nr:MFS transporter [Bradyrhizobium ivorense]VIO72729.1 4-hydroxybenzoate transporter PcaK [Bradyrhizobium ivorense]